ncbi:MAG TPA: energy-coupling factor transporter transmembrane component T [Planctomycetaceae bacterium]|nr:energy-coupling factor transporter transmembrane component T [Planctomycetaceae bacterium]
MNESLARPRPIRSLCHRLPPIVASLFSVTAITVGMLLPPTHWPSHGALLCVLFAALSLARVPFRVVAGRLAIFLAFALLFAASVPLSQGFRGGWEIAQGILLRGTESFLSGLWLISVVPFERLLATLRRLHVPAILLAILAFMYRFLFVLWDELDTMRAARRARTFDRAGLMFRWRNAAQMIGMLMIRSLGRSERVYGAMCARGWDGTLRTLDE